MRLHRLTVSNFRGISHADIDFDDVTVISGKNETGKSSLIDAFTYLIDHKSGSAKQCIKDAQPLGLDVGPRVEAELTIDGQRIRYTKQWLKQKETVLHYLDGPRAGQKVTGDQAHDAATALWESMDTALWNASQFLASTDPGQIQLDSSRVLREALEASAGTTADTDSMPLLEKVTEIAAQFYTPTGKEKGDLAAARAHLSDLASDLATASRDLADLDGLVANLADIDDQISRHRKLMATEAESLADLETRATAAQDAKAGLDRAVAHLDQCARDLADAQRASTDREARIADRDEAQAVLEGYRASIDNEAVTNLTKRVSESQARLEELKKARTTATEAVSAARDLAEARARAAQRTALAETLAKVDELRTQRAAIERPDVDTALLGKLDKLEVDLARATAVRDANTQYIDVDYLGETELLVNGQAASDRIPLRGTTVIEIPGQVRLTTTNDTDDSVEELTEKLDALLAEAGVSTGDDLRALIDQRRSADRDISLLDERIADVLDGSSRDDLVAELEKLPDEDVPDSDVDPDAARRELDDATTAYDEARDEHDRLRSELGSLKESHAGLEGQIRNQDDVLARAETALATARAAASDEAIAEQLVQARSHRDEAAEAHEKARVHLEDAGGISILEDLDGARTQMEALRVRERTLASDKRYAEGQLESTHRDEIQARVDQLESEEQAASTEFAALERRALAARYLRDSLTTHRDVRHASYVGPFRSKLASLAQIAYDDKTADVTVGTDLSVTHLVRDQTALPAEALSTGAREQLALLIRIAVADLVGDGGVPLLFDDVLGHSDQSRLRKMTSILNRATPSQLVIFTAHEERFAGLAGARYVRI